LEIDDMPATNAAYPRGKTAGLYPALPTRSDEAYAEFVEDARNCLLHAQQQPIAEFSRQKMSDAGMSQASDPESTNAAVEFLMQDSTIKTYYRVKRSLQESFWQCLRTAYDRERETLEAAIEAADGKGPGSVEYDPDFQVPEYATADIHLQPGGYTGDPLAGYLYDYGLKVFAGGAADNDVLAMMAAGAARPPSDGKVARVLDLGATTGATTTALKTTHPDAEVWGIDISAPMVRYAHLRAVEQDVDVHFKQMAAEQMDFPDDHFDVMLAVLLFHEVPVAIGKKIIAEAFRVLRPGGTLTVLDFPGDRSNDAYTMFFVDMDAADNGEPYLPDYVRSNVEDLLIEAGFEVRDYNPAMALATGRVAVKPAG
jgi:SAM-dependent methyltransferase